MDDLVTICNDVHEIIVIQENLTEILKRGSVMSNRTTHQYK